MDTNQPRIQIQQLSFITTLNPNLARKTVDMLSSLGNVETMRTGSTLFRAGDTSSDEGILLLDGEVSVIKEGSPETIAYSPHLLGEIVQFNPQKRRTATITAATDLQVIRFRWSDFKRHTAARLTPDEGQSLLNALQNYAWEHFTS